jgi:hypothetical protein
MTNPAWFVQATFCASITVLAPLMILASVCAPTHQRTNRFVTFEWSTCESIRALVFALIDVSRMTAGESVWL